MAEVEVLTDDHLTGSQIADECPLDESSWRLCGALGIEAHDVDRIDAGRLEELELLVQISEQFRSGLGTHDRCRMAIECHDHARTAKFDCSLANLGDDGAVTEMHPVVGADGDDAATIVVAWSGALGVTDNLHGASRYRFGKYDARFGDVSTMFVHRDESRYVIQHRPWSVAIEQRK